MTELKTIRQVARLGVLPEFRMREMLKQGELPGIYHGSRFMVNVGLLERQIESESHAATRGGVTHDTKERDTI